jgi:hypothetical protein
VAAAFIGALWAADWTIRKPGPGRALVLGVCLAAAVGIKLTALLVLPAAALLALAELVTGRFERPWLDRAAIAALVAFGVAYAGLVILYRGDLSLEETGGRPPDLVGLLQSEQ